MWHQIEQKTHTNLCIFVEIDWLLLSHKSKRGGNKKVATTLIRQICDLVDILHKNTDVPRFFTNRKLAKFELWQICEQKIHTNLSISVGTVWLLLSHKSKKGGNKRWQQLL